MKKIIGPLMSTLLVMPTASNSQGTLTSPAVTYLMETYGVTKAEATERIAVEDAVERLSEKLNADGDAAYGDMYIQHEPVYKIVILFADKSDRKAFLSSLDPKLRKYVQLKNAKKSRGLVSRELDEIAQAIGQLNISYTAKYDLASEQFRIRTENAADADRVNAALPATRKVETLVEVGPVPKTQAAPSGIVAGDRLFGGNALCKAGMSRATAWCTQGYAVSYTLGSVVKKGILTSGHCDNALIADVNGHDVVLSGPDFEKMHRNEPTLPGDGLSDQYDFQIFDATGLTVDNRIRYVDKNNIPEFPDAGELQMTGISSFLNQKAGMVMCKSGANTGITCGQITNGNAVRDGKAGWIEVSLTNQSVISVGGDSGSPWFKYPGTATTIIGVGVHTAGDAVPGKAGIAIYMPIDYIDDFNSTVNTIKQ